jgi:hypothetical protein
MLIVEIDPESPSAELYEVVDFICATGEEGDT